MRSGLKLKIYRTPMLTTRAQCGGRTSTRSHVAKKLLRQLERMADTGTSFSNPCHQAPFWKFLYAWRCRSLLSTSSLFSGISCSPVRQRMSILVANRFMPPRAHIPPVFADQGQVNIGELAEKVLHFLSFSTPSQPIPKPALIQSPCWGGFIGLRPCANEI